MVLAPRRLSSFLLALLACIPAQGDEPPDVTGPPVFEDFLVIPLRVHRLTSEDDPDLDCTLTEADVARIIGKVNGIWHQAGVHWGLESVAREPAAREGKFKRARELDGPTNLGLFRVLRPDDSREFDGLHVYYIHKFAVNGVWLGDGTAFVQDSARLRPVPGGTDEPIPRVTAHELGHALGLPHRQETTNLLASGTTGTLLNAREVSTARAHARDIKGCATVDEVREAAKAAEEKGEAEKARRLQNWLSEIQAALKGPVNRPARAPAGPDDPARD